MVVDSHLPGSQPRPGLLILRGNQIYPKWTGRLTEEPCEESKPHKASHEHLDQMPNYPSPEAESIVPRPNPLSKRLAIINKSDESIRHHFYLPFKILFTFPAVAYANVTYGLQLAWFAVISSAASYFMLNPPYSFNSSSVGLFMLSALIGAILVRSLVARSMTSQFCGWLGGMVVYLNLKCVCG